jgi:LysR family transcriptional regulator of gallate degradation
LRVFREVAFRRSMSEAGERENLSQPAVSQAIGKLSRQVGVRLLDRRSDGLHVTEAGGTFLTRVDRALSHLQLGAQEAVRLGQRKGNRGFPQFDRLLTSAQLRALIATADARNFSMAARRIGISQPSLHRAARNLEELSGLTLFRSAPEGISLTQGAQELARRAKLAFAELRQGLDQIAITLGRDSSFVAIGALPLARTSILPTAIARFIAMRDGVQVQVLDGAYEQLLARLRQGDLDFMVGALRFPPPADDIAQEVLFDDPLALVVGAGHPLLARRNPTLADTFEFPWVAPPPSTPAGSHLMAVLDTMQMTRPPIRVVSSSLGFVRGMLASGPYVSIISTHQARYEIAAGLFTPLPIALPGSSRSIGLTFRAEWLATPTQTLCIEMVRQAAQEEHGG